MYHLHPHTRLYAILVAGTSAHILAIPAPGLFFSSGGWFIEDNGFNEELNVGSRYEPPVEQR